MPRLFVAFTFLIPAAATAVSAEDTYRVSAAKGPYFVCDHRVSEDHWKTERFVNPLRKHESNPIIKKDFEWEGTGPHMGGSVLYDSQDRLFRMWYSVWNSHRYYNKLPFSYNVCYAESNDGMTWRKPALGVFAAETDPQNNVIRLGQDKTQNVDVCLNPRPDRYPGKFLAVHNQKGGVFVSHSDDGKSFTLLQDKAAISYHSDTNNNFVYDETADRWLLFCRPRAYAGDHKRRIAVQESPDLNQWTHERVILIPTETEKPEYYGMVVFRRGDLFFGLMQIYDRATGLMHLELAWSADGERWEQLPTHPEILSRGEQNSWDYGMVIAADAPVVMGDEMLFYYGGFALDHEQADNPSAIGLAIGERDRLVGMRPSAEEPGYVLTRPFLTTGHDQLSVNVVVPADGGRLRAELRDDNNRVLEGFSIEDCDPVTSSGYAQTITWNGRPLGMATTAEIRIRFELDAAQIYSYDFVEQQQAINK